MIDRLSKEYLKNYIVNYSLRQLLSIKPVIILLMIISSSCFKEDEMIAPYKSLGKSFAFEKSIYDTQFFYELGSNQIVKSNPVNDWSLCFDSSPKGWIIRVNSGDLLAVNNTGITDFQETTFHPDAKNWKYDKSNGDPDTLAIGRWVDTKKSPFVYSQMVYLIGKYDGIKYNPLKKIQFSEVNDSIYLFKYSDITNQNTVNVKLKKDTTTNYTYFNINTGLKVSIEPPKNTWDLMFGQYMTTLYTDQGVPTPYFVRGTLLNPYHVKAAMDSTHSFNAITKSQLSLFKFTSEWDVIGHDWKSVVVDEQSNTAKYTVRKNRFFLIEDTDGNFYKLRFTSFFNVQGEPGYPAFEYFEL